MGKRLTTKEIRRIRRLARTMRLKDVARVVGRTHTTVEVHAKGIRPQMNKPRVSRPQHACPMCGSDRVLSNGKEEWKCNKCGHRFNKINIRPKVYKREHRKMIQLRRQELTYKEIGKLLGRHEDTVGVHVRGKVIPVK